MTRKERVPWDPKEDALLVAAVEKFGAGNWRHIAVRVVGRTARQCRGRWLDHLRPGISKSSWSPEEDRIILEMMRDVGHSWVQIAKMLPGRTDAAVANRYHQTIRMRMIRESFRLKKNPECSSPAQTGVHQATLETSAAPSAATSHEDTSQDKGAMSQSETETVACYEGSIAETTDSDRSSDQEKSGTVSENELLSSLLDRLLATGSLNPSRIGGKLPSFERLLRNVPTTPTSSISSPKSTASQLCCSSGPHMNLYPQKTQHSLSNHTTLPSTKHLYSQPFYHGHVPLTSPFPPLSCQRDHYQYPYPPVCRTGANPTHFDMASPI